MLNREVDHSRVLGRFCPNSLRTLPSLRGHSKTASVPENVTHWESIDQGWQDLAKHPHRWSLRTGLQHHLDPPG